MFVVSYQMSIGETSSGVSSQNNINWKIQWINYVSNQLWKSHEHLAQVGQLKIVKSH